MNLAGSQDLVQNIALERRPDLGRLGTESISVAIGIDVMQGAGGCHPPVVVVVTETNRKTYNIPSKGGLFDFNYAFWILQQCSGIHKLNCTRVLSHNTSILPRRKQHQICFFSQIRSPDRTYNGGTIKSDNR